MRMPVKVELLEDGLFVSMICWGVLSRQETGWAHETVREHVVAANAIGILVDIRDTEITSTPAYSAEIVENFIFALERSLPIAFLPPLGWSEAHFERVWSLVPELDIRVEVFKAREAALDWLRIATEPADRTPQSDRKKAAH